VPAADFSFLRAYLSFLGSFRSDLSSAYTCVEIIPRICHFI
jgi:hypothetical protein